MLDCPPVAVLNDLLNDALPDARREDLIAHVQACSSCQGILQQLSSDPSWLPPTQPVWALAEAKEASADDAAVAAQSTHFLTRLKRRLASDGSGSGDELASGPARRRGVPAIDGYEVLGEIGRGAAGVVYRARHLKLHRLVALKVIHSAGSLPPESRRRFETEARAAARLRHPNIVEIYDVGEQNGCPFLSLELVEGENLARRIGRGKIGIPEAARLIERAARAIEYAHARGVIHRDLKPANIMLGVPSDPSHGPSEYELKITDFSLAKLLSDPAFEGQVTQSGTMLGTPAYMSPEQARGRVREIGPAADIYSLGAILYELLTGEPPFCGETPLDTLLLAAAAEPPRPGSVAPVPPDLETICLKCLEKDPGRRYPTAGGLAEDLSSFLDDEPIQARPVGRVERCIRRVRRRPAQTALLLGSALLGVLLLFSGIESYAQRQAAARTVQTDLRTAERLAQSSTWAQAAVALDHAEAMLGGGGTGELRDQLNRARSAVERARRRSELLQRTELIRLTRATRIEGRLNPEAERRYRNAKADREYLSAFSAAEIGSIGQNATAVSSRVTASDGVPELIAALDDWRVCAADRRRRDWLGDVLRGLDNDSWRSRVRAPSVWEDESALRRAAESAVIPQQPMEFLIALAERLGSASKDGLGLLRRVQQANPNEFWANLALGNALQPDDPQDAIAYYRRAATIRPASVAVLNNLGVAQTAAYVIPDATQTFQDALRRKQDDAATLSNFGFMWKSAGNYPQAEAYLRDAIKLDPDMPEARVNLAEIVAMEGGPGVVELLRPAIATDPRFARAHYLLGLALCARTPTDEADTIRAGRDSTHWGAVVVDPIAYYHAAVWFDPTWFPVTQDRARLPEAIAEYRLALACDPLLWHAYGALGQALLNRGECDAALQATRRALELQDEPHAYGSTEQERAGLAGQIQRCQREIELAARLPLIVDGSAAPANAEESLEMAELCVAMELHEPAARLYLRAFTAEPALAAEPTADDRYRALCAAALAGADAGPGDAPRWRQQSREWLRAELGQLAEALKRANRPDAIRTYFRLSEWITDPALTSIRNEASLAPLSPEEREQCLHLWADVRALRARAEAMVNQTPAPQVETAP